MQNTQTADLQQRTPARPRVVVIGGGYAGTMAANRLGPHADVVMINPRPRFVERIRLHQWAGSTGPADRDYADVLSGSVRLVVGSATRIDAPAGRVELATQPAIGFDHLVYAVGSTGTPPDAIDGVAEFGYSVAEWEGAQRLRSRLAKVDPAETVTVVGGGLTAVEVAAELADTGRRVRLVCNGTLTPSFSRRGRSATLSALARLGVEIHEHTRVSVIGADTVTMTTDGTAHIVASAVTVDATGYGVPGLASVSGLSVDPLGRLLTDETLTSIDDPRIVGAGDAVAPSNQPLRMSCQAAVPMGLQAANTVVAHLRGANADPLRMRWVSQIASLGRHRGTAQFSRRDGTSNGLVATGRIGARIKELVCRSTITGLGYEARHPGRYPSFGGTRDLEPSTADDIRSHMNR